MNRRLQILYADLVADAAYLISLEKWMKREPDLITPRELLKLALADFRVKLNMFKHELAAHQAIVEPLERICHAGR